MSVKRFLGCLLIGCASLTAHAETFVFTAIPDEDATRLRERFEQVADYLSDQLAVEVQYIPVKSYGAAITAFRNNQVQLAWFGGLSGVRARQLVPGSEALAQGYEDQFFKSYIIAHHSTGLSAHEKLPKTLRGMTFTFGAKGSTSGRLMPEFYLREALGHSPEELFERVGFSGDHSRTIAQVQAGAYQLGAVNYKVWENELEAGNIDLEKVRIIWTSPSYPDYQWTVRGGIEKRFGDGFKARLQRALLDMEAPELLEAFPRSAFVPADNGDYQPIEDIARAIGLLE